ncbi:hypothetical protein KO527_05115 [Pseudoalteromonas sp. C2R02]|uniref:hypothetical protein n=1 Tax=Pseudoalteromonas sp. C2R02 TaxID=2841565 RepID=UPI001C0A30D5|nr:hypothetical protein [Pseudoalteromonas sp. C2R02]MBU2968727.1 hypothetical protein [Pseudoalteromonas sp. C2R02]
MILEKFKTSLADLPKGISRGVGTNTAGKQYLNLYVSLKNQKRFGLCVGVGNTLTDAKIHHAISTAKEARKLSKTNDFKKENFKNWRTKFLYPSSEKLTAYDVNYLKKSLEVTIKFISNEKSQAQFGKQLADLMHNKIFNCRTYDELRMGTVFTSICEQPLTFILSENCTLVEVITCEAS